MVSLSSALTTNLIVLLNVTFIAVGTSTIFGGKFSVKKNDNNHDNKNKNNYNHHKITKSSQVNCFYSWIYPRVLVRFFMQMCHSCVTGSSI